MNKIRVLPDNLSNQIAAGEVVERPASVIKELVENSLDAGATRVHIDTELGGRRLMRITDNGEGMLRDDAILAFERHATSKIKTLEDLSSIATLGFRGEALASIASVAKIELITKTEEDAIGTRVIIEGGRLIDVKDAARPRGTTLSVRDLFFNTPARRKFMRSEATENYHLTSIVTHYALARPEIAFVLTSNGREVLRASPAKDLRERAFQLFGANLIESLLHVEGGREYIAKIRGFVSAPRERRTTRDQQFFFINNRFVRDKLISKGLSEGFRSVLPYGVYPVAFLFLDVPLEEVDVNVHPAKTEVRFRRAEAVREVIAEAVRRSLAGVGIVREEIPAANVEAFPEFPRALVESGFEQQKIELYQAAPREAGASDAASPFFETAQPFAETTLEPQNAVETQNTIEIRNADGLTAQFSNEEPLEMFSADFERISETKIGADKSQTAIETDAPQPNQPERLTENPAPAAIPDSKSQIPNYKTLPPVDSAARLPQETAVEKLAPAKIRPVGQLRDSYIIAVDDEGLLLIDQHVAHERILFDKFRRREGSRAIESQNLLLPEIIDLTPAQVVAFDVIEPELANLGFSVMRLSGRTIAVKSVPTDLPVKEIKNLLAELIETVAADSKRSAVETVRDQIAASLACRAAVKINMPLAAEKMQWLIDRLAFTNSPTTCPHGRPIVLRLTIKDIERAFHRT